MFFTSYSLRICKTPTPNNSLALGEKGKIFINTELLQTVVRSSTLERVFRDLKI